MGEPSLVDIWNQQVRDCLVGLRRAFPEHAGKTDGDLLADARLRLSYALTIDRLADGDNEQLQNAMVVAVGSVDHSRELLHLGRMFGRYCVDRKPMPFYVSLGYHPPDVERCLSELDGHSSKGSSK